MELSYILVIVIIGLLILTAAAGISKRSGSKTRINEPELAYEKKTHLMSPAERSFFGVLEQALEGGYYIFSKVRLEDIIQVKKGLGKKETFGLRNSIKSRHIDFILCDKNTLEILMCIELDDKSHQRKDRADRDRFVDSALAVAAVPIVRIPARASYSVDFVKSSILDT